MSKTLEDLQASRDRRAQIQLKFGCIPTSIMIAEKTKWQSDDPHAMKRNYAATSHVPIDAVASTIFDVSGQSCRGQGGALSGFPQNIGRYLVKMYSHEGQTVLDPFAGHNSRMELTYRLGRSYIGYDVSAAFMHTNREIRSRLLGATQGVLLANPATITLIESDSRLLQLATPADFCVTSPPYWDLEDYGNEAAQLGKVPTYDGFIADLGLILRRCYDNLKAGSFCAWCVNDFRRNGVFYPYHSSVIDLFRQSGFTLHDIIVVDLGYPIGACFASQLEDQQRTAKRHEYVIVGRR